MRVPGRRSVLVSAVAGATAVSLWAANALRPTADVQRVLNPPSDINRFSDGRILADGRFRLTTADQSEFLTRFNPDGTVDLPFTQNLERYFDVRVRRPGVYAAFVDDKDRTIVAWAARNENQNLVFSDLVRLLPEGTIDAGFGTRGAFGPGSQILWIRRDPKGKILIGGRMNYRLGDEVGLIYRLDEKGGVDRRFKTDLPLGDESAAQSAAVFPDGRIVVGLGYRKAPDENAPAERETIALLGASGKKSAAFGRAVRRFNGHPVLAVALQPDGQILAGGVGLLVRLSASGAVDPGFRRQDGLFSSGRAAAWTVRAIAVQPDGKILVGGDFQFYEGRPAGMLVRLNPDGSLDEAFQRNLGAGFTSGEFVRRGIFSVSPQRDGRIALAGTFIRLDNVDAPYLARLNPDGTRDDFPRISLVGLTP